MDFLQQPDVKKTYEKCKYIVKVWEHKFTKKHKRLPSKLDIREANSEVRHAYRKYFQLKTAALEQSFIDVEGFDNEEDGRNDDEEDGSNKNKESTHTVLNEMNQNSSPLEEKSMHDNVSLVQTIEIPKEIWGIHLNKKDEESKPVLKKEEASKPNLNLSITKKLFCGSKFTKRNPRKSLSFSQKNKSDINVDGQMSLSQPISKAQSFSIFKSEDAIILSQDDSLFKNDKFQIISAPEKIISQPVNIIQSVLQNGYQHSLKTLDSGWLERVARKTGTTIENPNLTIPASQHCLTNALNANFDAPVLKVINTETEATKIDYDSEDIIDDSDEDTPCSQITSLHIVKKKRIENISEKNLNTHLGSKSFNNIHSVSENHVIPCSTQEVNLKGEEPIANETVTDKCINTNIESIDTNAAEVFNYLENGEIIKKNKKTDINQTKEPRKKSYSKTPKTTSKSKSKPHCIKKETPETKVEQKEISPRRSSRQTRVKVSLQEFPSEEEDAFHTDTDEKDPEFILESEKSNDIFKQEIEKTREETINVLSKNKKRKSIHLTPKKNSSSKKIKKMDKSKDHDEEVDESKPYELEFSVKPRIVAPRYSSIKKVLMEKTIVTKGDKAGINLEDENDIKEDMSIMKSKRQQAKENLEKKIASGNLNDNFIRINLKKKIFARGKSGKSFSKYKKAQWKSKKAKSLCGPEMDMGGCDGGMLTCFNCGQIGHFARNCKAMKGDGLLPLVSDQEDCPYPTLEEASQMARESTLSVRKPKLVLQEKVNLENGLPEPILEINEQLDKTEREEDRGVEDTIEDFDDEFDDDLIIETLKLEENVKKLDVRLYMDTVKVVKPYFELNEDGSTVATPLEVYKTLNKFGHSSFRPGQEQAIMRILSGKSTLVTLSTGSGKSLCYQLPAYLYSQREPCISLIISPLVSLMDDQVVGIPKFMKAACLHSNQTKIQRQKILEAISMGELSILLISPEAVVAGEKQTGFGSLLRKLPPIAFACIDEAHCVSQWSHNFRPSYLMICRVLRESLGVKNILGLTATATRATRDSIIKHLQIPDGLKGIISDIPLPDNLMLTVSKDPIRDHALLGLLMSERFADCKSIIVYCTRRDECERIASFLRTSLKSEQIVENTNKKRKRVNLQAEPYHAGLSASRRRTIQNKFMSGELRIVVATVAFGMGINKSDIRAVIHFNMPNSFESYVQEVGRAGRDGLRAHCHVFLDSQGRDEQELRRHIHANSIDRHVIRKLLEKIFIPCSCSGQCPKHEVAFSIESTVRALDIPEENISTLLCYLELHENKYVQLLNPAYTMCKVISYGGPLQIRKAAKECPPLAMALALHKSKVGDDPNVLEFPVVDVAAAMGWESGICKHKLKNLEWTTVNNQQKRSSISVQFSNLGLRLLAPGNLSDDQLDEALDSLYNRVINQEQKALLQLHAVHKTLTEVAQPSYRACKSENDDTLIKEKVREYFNSSDPLKFVSEIEPKKFNEDQLVSDIRALICMYRDNTFTGRSVARIFQGIQSPNYPAVIWGRCKFWRSHLDIDFHSIVKIATREIIRMR